MLESSWIEASLAILAPLGVGLRDEAPADLDFLIGLYASTRDEELAQVPWPEEVKAAFLTEQFRLQNLHYTRYYPGLVRLVITQHSIASGRLYLHRSGADWRIVDIALLPKARRKHIGTTLLTAIGAQAHREGGYASIHVEIYNPARHLYERLGFQAMEEKPPYVLMHWHGKDAETTGAIAQLHQEPLMLVPP